VRERKRHISAGKWEGTDQVTEVRFWYPAWTVIYIVPVTLSACYPGHLVIRMCRW